MFEQEAEDYATRDVFFDGVPKPVVNHQRKEDWQKGAEFGYNKAKQQLAPLIKELLDNAPNNYTGSNIDAVQHKMFAYMTARTSAEQLLEDWK